MDERTFRNNCQKWHTYFSQCADDGNRSDEVLQLFERVNKYFELWKKRLFEACSETRKAEKQLLECRKKEASIQLHLRMLKQLLTIMDHRIRQ